MQINLSVSDEPKFFLGDSSPSQIIIKNDRIICDSGGWFFKNAMIKQMGQLVLKTGPNEQVPVLTGSFV